MQLDAVRRGYGNGCVANVARSSIGRIISGEEMALSVRL